MKLNRRNGYGGNRFGFREADWDRDRDWDTDRDWDRDRDSRGDYFLRLHTPFSIVGLAR